MAKERLDFQYGAVYFRKSNPPKADWERDYAQAARDHMNIFRHWFLWGAIEVAPGQYDWADYDEQLDLAAKYGIRTVVAEQISSVPEWMARAHPDWFEKPDGETGQPVQTGLSPSCATGGFGPGLCLDHPKAREAAGGFLRALASRYKLHPGMYAYDIWNESNHAPRICRCEHTQQAFRAWLMAKYGSLSALNTAWHRYSYASWEDVRLPRGQGIYPENVDLLEFMKARAYEQMDWRIACIRAEDPENRITAHGLAGSVDGVEIGCDDWLAAGKVQGYGFTWCPCRKGNEPWKQMHAVDLTRTASRGKPFWHSEMQGGPLWLQPQLPGRPIEDGRIPTARDTRLWNLKTLMGGASGILYPRWRPLLDGPLFGAFGVYGNDGLPTERSEMGARIAAWAQDAKQDALFRARPVRGDVGIVLLPENQRFNHFLEQGGPGRYDAQCAFGAYKAFVEQNIQADFLHIEDIDAYHTLYLPYPLLLRETSAQALRDWVRRGGTLIAEGCLGYFSETLTVQTTQPGSGFDQDCGVRERDVAFIPDLSEDIWFEWRGQRVPGALFRQSFEPQGAQVLARYADQSAAVVQNTCGAGKIILIGTYPSAGYLRTGEYHARQLLSDLFAKGGHVPQVTRLGHPDVYVRLWEDAESRRRFLWAINPLSEAREVEVATAQPFSRVKEMLWGEDAPQPFENMWVVKVPPMDAVIFEIE